MKFERVGFASRTPRPPTMNDSHIPNEDLLMVLDGEQPGPRMVQIRAHFGCLLGVPRSPEPRAGFVLVLGNGRRIESGWRFADAELVRLICLAGKA
jgi:hypothetical protein